MSKSKADKAIKELWKYHTDAVNKIGRIRACEPYTEEFKQAEIDALMAKYNAAIGKYKSDAKEAVEAIEAGITEKRQAELKKGLEAAEMVNNVVNGIKGGIYTPEMLRDIVSVNADNAYAMKTIKGALTASENQGYQSIGLEIPTSNDDRIAHNLKNIINGINDMPSPLADSRPDNPSIGFYQNGTTFSGWCDYIDSNIEE